MPRRRREGRMRVAVGVGVVAAVFLVLYGVAHTRPGAGLVWRFAKGTRYEQDFLRWQLTGNRDPVVRALARGDIRAGQRAEEVVGAHSLIRVETVGRYERLQPPGEVGMIFEGYAIVAKDGRVAAADWWACTAPLVIFFDTMTAAEHADFNQQADAARGQRYQSEVLARMAVGGSLPGARDPWNW